MKENKKLQYKTICVHSGGYVDEKTLGAVTPVYPSTSYAYLDMDIQQYPRAFNTPNQRVLADKIAALEHGEQALVFSSGMAAITSAFLALLGPGDHAVFQKGLYGGTTGLLTEDMNNFGREFTFTKGIQPEDFEKEIKPNTKFLYIETPSNPILNITDIKAIVELAKSRGLLTIIDNTFATPINQQSMDIGVDVVIHSATKYFGGHSDIIAGAVVADKNIIEKIRSMAHNLGGSLNAMDCYLLERSMKTLALRVEQQSANAMKIAEFLSVHNKVQRVYYPGLKDHTGHNTARKQMRGFGAMLSFELKDGMDPIKFQKSLEIFLPSMSLGGVESLICSPAMTSHSSLTPEQREKEGVKDTLLRLSAGIEDVEDLIADLNKNLK